MTRCQAEHIAIGTEILLGQIANGHARDISESLAADGFHLFWHTAVGDNISRIKLAFGQAALRSNVVIVTGGLGPTDDDLTREALAAYLERDLLQSPSALAQMESYFAGRKRVMPAENRKQAMFVDGGDLLPNPFGTAPGLYVEKDGRHWFVLPGPPREMKPMLISHVLPRLHALFPDQPALASRVLHFCGIGESDIDEQVRELTSCANPTVAPLASEGEMLLRVTATAPNRAAALAMIQPIETDLRQRFGRFLYGVDEDTLAAAVGKALLLSRKTVAVAESCTGGLVSSMITAVPGASDWFLGAAVTYQNAAKTRLLGVEPMTLADHGAVSQQTATEMAVGVLDLFGADYGLSVTGIAGPGGGSADKPIGLVYGTIATAAGNKTYRVELRGSREQIQLRAAKVMLWRLWQAETFGMHK